ncbi:MAG: 7-carboxy-7-deazaguanine synthase [Candidatus Sabulitectum sp.]|nr:7-carboxy-7-deazaguanine synthase [Candidatus Sabulitectum sp.]
MSNNYRIKEMLLTLQGEGAMTGTAVVLLRFEGCNLNCDFCDTDFTGTDGEGGGIFNTASELAEAVQSKWLSDTNTPNVLCTGGEPLMQLDRELIKEFHAKGFRILVETNGTVKAQKHIDWICVSPKTNEIPVQRSGDEIKIVWPQEKTDPGKFEKLEFNYFWIQPKFDRNYKENLKASIEYCLANPRWRLSIQTHRVMGIP